MTDRVDKASLPLNQPRRTPSHPTKSHIVKTKVDGKEKIIRFGEQGASTAGKPKAGESERMVAKRKSFKSRHAKNIAKGPSSAAYWANRVKWAAGGLVEGYQTGGITREAVKSAPLASYQTAFYGNPNLAQQGALARNKVQVPTSVMDPRYAAWKKSQDQAEELEIISGVLGGGLGAAGVLSRGVSRADAIAAALRAGKITPDEAQTIAHWRSLGSTNEARDNALRVQQWREEARLNSPLNQEAARLNAGEPQKMRQGLYRGYSGDRAGAEEIWGSPQKKVADYYAARRAAENAEEPHVEMLMVDPFNAKVNKSLGIPMDKFNREPGVQTQARGYAPENIDSRIPLYARGGLARYKECNCA
jgi:hypothetical protein